MTTLWQTPARRALLAIPFLITGVALGQSNPVKLATQARFDLLASVSVGALTNGYILEGSGALERQTWLAAADQPRSYTANLSIFHFTWTELVARFTPTGSGTVELTLRGPWQHPPGGGAIYKQEVLWDALSAENTVVPNGSFETLQGVLPTGWSRPYGAAYATNDPLTAVDGARMARVWHDAPLTCTLTVTGGVPVTLRFFARAQTPVDFTDLARITNRHSAAHQAARRFMRGANLGNYLEAPPGQNWGAQYRTNDFAWIRAEGFDHVRLPIAWHHYTGPPPDYLLSPTIFTRADFLVTNALRHTPPGGSVTVSCGGGDDSAWLAVEDSGAGIPEADRDRVFERFYQSPGSSSRGSGLGLAIVKHIVVLHHGEISVSSEMGRGTTFRISIPPLGERKNESNQPS